ncbi:MAG: Rhamnosyl O-methyltransferase precursor [Planctomycetes bacterium ADurb.Bin401]|nr:MAG: Rhamnosyl O-methyltransferase precursor [Planctomycetes bacterium ADurb.Bin401]
MAEKKLFTRQEFEKLRIDSAAQMAADKKLKADALDVLVRADHHRWIHQTNWMGEPILNLPQDMFAIQDIICRTKPKYIIESGVAWGGSLLFYSTIMEAIDGGKIIGIDTYIPDDLRERLNSHGKISQRITLINGSSVEQTTVDKVRAIIGDCREVMVVLDSFHTHEHVLNELRLYSPLVGKGFYLVCGDTIVEDIPEQTHRTRPWGRGNNPKTALWQFLKENDRFETDKETDNKLLLTCNPDGYLKCVKD